MLSKQSVAAAAFARAGRLGPMLQAGPVFALFSQWHFLSLSTHGVQRRVDGRTLNWSGIQAFRRSGLGIAS